MIRLLLAGGKMFYLPDYLLSHMHIQLRHIPRSPLKPRPVPVKTRYPAALLPGQYSDNYPIFTPQELSQLPLNTVSGEFTG